MKSSVALHKGRPTTKRRTFSPPASFGWSKARDLLRCPGSFRLASLAIMRQVELQRGMFAKSRNAQSLDKSKPCAGLSLRYVCLAAINGPSSYWRGPWWCAEQWQLQQSVSPLGAESMASLHCRAYFLSQGIVRSSRCSTHHKHMMIQGQLYIYVLHAPGPVGFPHLCLAPRSCIRSRAQQPMCRPQPPVAPRTSTIR